MNMQPFNLERFKAGEPAYGKHNHDEYFYLAEFPDGRIAVSFLNYDDDYIGCDQLCLQWDTFSISVQYLNNEFYMKEKELTWVEVLNMRATDFLDRDLTYIPLSEWLDENFEVPKRKNQ